MRPFWTADQRLFACYQLLEAVAQLHDVFGIVHGDLKLENCLITSSGWLYLVDMAPFKPTFLPVFNPANLESYYDNSENRTCCSAPEKFFEAKVPVAHASPVIAPQAPLGHSLAEVASIGNIQQRPSSPVQQATSKAAADSKGSGGAAQLPPVPIGPLQELQHTRAMDMFSAACHSHILTDEPLFKLPDVLKLRSLPVAEKEAFVSSLLASRGIPAESPVSQMLQSVLCSPPETRPTARQLLHNCSGGALAVFPSYFAFLHNNVMPQVLRQPPDGAMHLLWSRVDDMFDTVRHCVSEEGQGKDRPSVASLVGRVSHTINAHNEPPDSCKLKPVSHPDVQKAFTVVTSLLLPFLLSMGRHVRTADATCKLLALVYTHPTCNQQRATRLLLPLVLYFLRSRSAAAAHQQIYGQQQQ